MFLRWGNEEVVDALFEDGREQVVAAAEKDVLVKVVDVISSLLLNSNE